MSNSFFNNKTAMISGVIFLFWPTLIFAGGAESQGNIESAGLPAKEQLFEYYLGRADGLEGADTLPAVLEGMAQNSSCDVLEKILVGAGVKLFEQAGNLELSMGLFFPGQKNPAKDDLDVLLGKTNKELLVVEGGVQDLLQWLDNYGGEDWDRRFGQTDFYESLLQIRHNVQVSRAAWLIFRASVDHYGLAGTAGNQDRRGEKLYGRMTAAVQQLSELIDHAEQSDAARETVHFLYLWQARMFRVMSFYQEQFLQEAQRQGRIALKSKPEPDIEFALRFEMLRCGLHKLPNVPGDYDAVFGKIARLRGWLRNNTMKDSSVGLFRLAVLESILLQQKQKQVNSAEGLGPRGYLSNRRYLLPLIELAKRDDFLKRSVAQLVCRRLAVLIGQLDQPGDHSRWVVCLKTASDFELLNLAQYYSGSGLVRDYRKAILIFEIFLQQRSADHEKFSDVLYEVGLCSRKLADELEPADVQMYQTRKIKTIEYWNRLGKDFPRWQSKKNGVVVSSGTVLSRSAGLAWELFCADEKQFAKLALQTLELLVGRYESKTGTLTGDYCQLADSRSYRYHYGLVLRSAGRLKQAAEILTMVEPDDSHKPAARYYTAICHLKLCTTGDLPDADRAKLRAAATAELASLVEDERSKSAFFYRSAVLQLVRMYQEEGELGKAMRVLCQTIAVGQQDDRLINLGVNLVSEQRQRWLNYHSNNQREKLIELLADTLALSRVIFDRLSVAAGRTESEEIRLKSVRRSLLDQLALAAAILADCSVGQTVLSQHSGKSIQLDRSGLDYDDAVESAGELLMQAAVDQANQKQLWFVRCHALFAYAMGDYAKSQQLWYRLRSGTGPDHKDEELRYYWWEGRYYGLRCLAKRSQIDQAVHSLEVFLNSREYPDNPWLRRMQQLQGELADLQGNSTELQSDSAKLPGTAEF